MSDNDDFDYPDIESDEYLQIETAVRKAIRLLLKEGHPYEPTKLIARQEVIFALNGTSIPNELLRIIVSPLMDIRGWIWEEYAEKQLWTLGEAASLSVGMDPVMYQFEPGQFYNGWRENRDQAFNRTREAILLGKLPAIPEGGSYHISPYAFCSWALEAGLLSSNLTTPLRDLAQEEQFIEHQPTVEVMLERFVTYAQQRLFAEGLSHPALRKRALYSFAIYAKIDNPKESRQDLARLVFNSLSKDCQELKGDGFALDAIRNDLYKLDKQLDPSAKQRKEFFNLVPSDKEIMSTDPTHRWWSQWRPVIKQQLPWIELPE